MTDTDNTYLSVSAAMRMTERVSAERNVTESVSAGLNLYERVTAYTDLGPGPTTDYFLDTFTDVDGTSLFVHVPDVGGAWASGGATATQGIFSNRLRVIPTTANLSLYYASIGQSDYVLSATYLYDPVVATSITGSLVFRYVDASNYWRLDIAPLTGVSNIRLREITAGVNTIRAAASLALSAGVTYTLGATLSGTSISASINATTLNFTSANHQTATLAGLAFQQTSGTRSFQYFDDFKAIPLP
jgi:hypothetical protein